MGDMDETPPEDARVNCRLVGWKDIQTWSEKVAESVRESGYHPDIVVGITRGGWVPARIICDVLGVRHLYSLKTEHWGVTAAPDGRVAVNPTGGPALGSGGTGDVLTGVVTGLLAQGVAAFEAAALAAFVHGAAADRIEAASGTSGLTAGDLARALPEEFDALRAEAREVAGAPHPGRRLAISFPEP